MPITWKNVHARSDRTGAALLEGAQDSLTAASDQFEKVFARRRQTQDANRDNTIDNNTAAFRDYVNSFGSPEELAEAEESGLIDQKRAEFGALLDRDATRGLEADRLTGLRQADTAEYKYNQAQQARRENPIRDDALAMALDGDMDGALEMAGQVENNAELVQEIQKVGRTRTQRALTADDERIRREQRDAQIAREEAERERLGYADDLVTQMTGSRNQRMNRNDEVRAAIADDMGVSYVNGKLNVDSMSESEITEFNRRIEQEGAGAAPSATESVKDFKKRLRESDLDLTNAEIETYADTFGSTIADGLQLEAPDQTELNQRFAALDDTYAREQEKEDAEFEQIQANNVYARPPEDKDAKMGEMTAFLQEEGFNEYWRADDPLRRNMVDQITQALSSGVDIESASPSQKRSKTGPGPAAKDSNVKSSSGSDSERIPVTTGMVQAALNAVKDDGDMDELFLPQLRKMIQENGFAEKYKEGVQAREQYEERSDALRKKYNRARLATEGRFLSERGVRTETGNDLRSRMEARLKKLIQKNQ